MVKRTEKEIKNNQKKSETVNTIKDTNNRTYVNKYMRAKCDDDDNDNHNDNN